MFIAPLLIGFVDRVLDRPRINFNLPQTVLSPRKAARSSAHQRFYSTWKKRSHSSVSGIVRSRKSQETPNVMYRANLHY